MVQRTETSCILIQTDYILFLIYCICVFFCLIGAAWFNLHIHNNIIMGCDATLWGPNTQYYNNIAVLPSCNGLFAVAQGVPPLTNSGFFNNTLYELGSSNNQIYFNPPCQSSSIGCQSQSPWFYNNNYYTISGIANIYSGLTLDQIQHPVSAALLGYGGLNLNQNETGSKNFTLPATWPYFRPAIQSLLGLSPSIPTSSSYVFQCTGAAQSWTATCSSANVVAIGAGGSTGVDNTQRICKGGSGGVVNVTMAFTIGQIYSILVGCTSWGWNPNANIPVVAYPAGGTGGRFG